MSNKSNEQRDKSEGQPQLTEDKLTELIVNMYQEIKTENEDALKEPNEYSVYEFYDEEEEIAKAQQMEEKRKLKQRTCKICSKVFEDPLCVLRHKRHAHSTKKIILPKADIEPHLESKERSNCPICFKKIPKKGCKSEYIKHLMIHCDQYDFICKVCGMKFRRKDHLQLHEVRHIVPAEAQ
ncbi:PR domain zinc finger protein 15-like [Euwallacea fornicatus]|uniref:PR domain zinc finger protein 15-like n=1 Tax=Euwallacea fornicatus TaxID=995702 RepID=UPI00338D73C2